MKDPAAVGGSGGGAALAASPLALPPMLLAAALVFWGWQTGLWPAACLMASVLEGARLLPWRWDLARSDFNRVSDLCTIVFVSLVVYLGATTDAPRVLTLVFQWFPLVALPLVAAQVFSTSPGVDVRIFLWSQRKKADAEGTPATHTLDLRYPYFVICILAASAANVRGMGFYAGATALTAVALWSARPRVVRPAVWGGLFLLVAALGWVGHVGLHQAQRAVEAVALEWLAEWMRRDTDPFRSSTAIGSIGRLKLSDRIILRVDPGPSARMPLLLREATYNAFAMPAWLAVDATWSPVLPEADGTTWRLGPAGAERARVTVSASLRRGRGVLALPADAFEIDRLTVVRVEKNRLGAVKVDEGLGLVTYTARSGARSVLDDPPSEGDLALPIPDGALATRVARELGLRGGSAADAVVALHSYFRANFRYSLHRPAPEGEVSALEDFLRRSRAGHCEYFATATVLLLRAAGVPARYAIGYSVQEWSPLERTWVVRARHAHSWALAWVDGAWRDVDTTPPGWGEIEGGQASVWQPVSDLFAWAGHAFNRWRYGERRGNVTSWLGWLLIPLMLLLIWRLFFRRRQRRAGAAPAGSKAPRARAGMDSEFYAVEGRLNALGLGRRAAEPPMVWLDRVRDQPPVAQSRAQLARLVALHYRYRFDPSGLSEAERARLRAEAEAWLADVERRATRDPEAAPR
jgi:protein-glutamine gamma-glutamyltransferase